MANIKIGTSYYIIILHMLTHCFNEEEFVECLMARPLKANLSYSS